MSLSDWDVMIAPRLRSIEAGALMAAHHARALIAKPSFDTLAEHELAEARKSLQNALALIVAAQGIYESKPLESA